MIHVALLAALCASPAFADLNVAFIEGAPKDRFEISSSDACLTGPVTVTIDLTASAGGLIFDTTGQGAGVNVFQPFEMVQGQALVTRAPSVLDGDKLLSLQLNALPMGQTVAFTLDVDDTGGGRETVVNGAEIAGARAGVQTQMGSSTADFDATARASIAVPACVS